MSGQIHDNKPRSVLPRRVWILTALVSLLLIAFGGWRLSLSRAIEAQRQALRDASYPATSAELEAWHKYPKGDNAAELYMAIPMAILAAHPQRDAMPYLGEGLSAPGEPLTAEATQAMAAGLALSVDALTDLQKAANVAASRYPIDYAQGVNAMLPNLGDLRLLAKVASLEALDAAINGQAQRATDALVAAIAVGRSLKNEPMMIGQLVHWAILDQTSEAVEDTLCRLQLSDGQLRRLDAALAAASNPDGLRFGLVGETVAWSDFFSRPDLMSGVHGDDFLFKAYRLAGFWDLDHVGYLHFHLRMIDATKLPEYKRTAEFEAVKTRIQALPTWRKLASIAAVYDAHIRLDLEQMARVRLTRTAIAIERYRLAHGSLPVTLGDLLAKYLDAVPADPFVDAPLNYLPHKPVHSAFKIYSVGEDQTDDGGVRTNAAGKHNAKGPDIPFVVDRKPVRDRPEPAP